MSQSSKEHRSIQLIKSLSLQKQKQDGVPGQKRLIASEIRVREVAHNG